MVFTAKGTNPEPHQYPLGKKNEALTKGTWEGPTKQVVPTALGNMWKQAVGPETKHNKPSA